MYCPKCGVANLEGAAYCRACGANLGLVPQALAGRLPEDLVEVEEQERDGRRERKYKFKEPPTLEHGLENVFIGVALLVIFLLGLFYFQSGFMLWVWFIIPALACMGNGIGEIIRSRRDRQASLPHGGFADPPRLGRPQRAELHAPDTSEFVRPPESVTEGTTRRLAVASETDTRDPAG